MRVSDRTTRALDQLEEAGHFLALLAEHPPDVEPRPPWWRPLARYRHLVDHDEQLAVWAEGIETAAEDYRLAERDLATARQRDDLDDALR
jgi:hypothetical protein